MNKTPYYNLNKPEGADYYNVEDFNQNADKLDTALHNHDGSIGQVLAHISNHSNPHNVTKEQIGLGNVQNTADNQKSVHYAATAGNASTVGGFTVGANVPADAKFTDTTYSPATTEADGLMSSSDKTKLNGIAAGAEVNVQADWNETDTTSDAYIQNKPSIPSQVTVDNALSTTSENPVQNKVITGALADKADSSSLSDVATSGSYNDLDDKPTIPSKVSELTNDSGYLTSETDPTVPSWAKATTKPTYTASEVGAIATTQKGTASGVAELDANGKVPSSQLPSYVDDVVEGYYNPADHKFYADSSYTTEITGETGKIYVDLSTDTTYRWSGSAFVAVGSSLALGETSSTAYRGDRGKTAYDHSQLTTGNPHNVTATDVGLGNVGNFKAVSTVANQGLTEQEKSNARSNIGAGSSTFSGSYNDLTDKPGTVSKTAIGFCPQLPNETTTTKFLRQDGSWSKPECFEQFYQTTEPTGGKNGDVWIG